MVNFHGLCQLYVLFSLSLSVFSSFPFCSFNSLCLFNNISLFLCQFSFLLPNSHSLYICLSFPLSLSLFSLSNYSISNSLCQFSFPLPNSIGLFLWRFLFNLAIAFLFGIPFLFVFMAFLFYHYMMHCSMV